MRLPEQIDDSNYVPDEQFEPLPPGDYPMMITGADIEPTKDGSGKLLKLELQVLDGHHHGGRKLFDRLMLESTRSDDKMATALRIAKGRLHSIREGLGLTVLNDTNQLVGQSLRAKVRVRPPKGDYGAGNDVAGYASLHESQAPTGPAQQTSIAQPSPQQPTTAAPKPQPVAAGTGAAPWAR